MKFPSIIRLPKHRTFNFSNRYFDPIKDELDERTERIKREIAVEQKSGTDTGESFRASIKFERKQASVRSASTLQLIIAAALACICFGWLYYGNDIFYAGFIIFPIYIYYRFKNKFK